MIFSKKIKRNKKGSALDLILVAGIGLFFAMIVLFGFKMVAEFNDEVQANTGIDAKGKAAVNTLEGHYSGVIDNSFLLLTIGLCIGAIVMASLVRISPIFLGLFIIIWIIIIVMCGVFSNIYQEMAENTEMQAQANQLTFISNIMEFLPLIIGVVGGILAIIMYKSWRDTSI